MTAGMAVSTSKLAGGLLWVYLDFPHAVPRRGSRDSGHDRPAAGVEGVFDVASDALCGTLKILREAKPGDTAWLGDSGGGTRTPDTRIMIRRPPSRPVSVGLAFRLETGVSAAPAGRSSRPVSVALVPT